MKRPPGLWILLSAGFLWLSFDDVDGVKATSLIFGKSTTTTTTEQTEIAKEEEVTTTETVDANSTKPILTGNPQLDYVWDPNLPKELNGYNLSDYPFYERVPENIKFKCDGLHDGFYASVQHKCQVYHNCLFGIRYDFLCANYTAFDQTLFNCNFVSNVDCENSKKFWHRNDDLYQEKSTTAAPVVYNFYTPPPDANAQTPIPRGQVSPRQRGRPRPAEQIAPQPAVQVQPQVVPQPVVYADVPYEARGRQRPPARRRPVYDYYDDYEERPRRPKPRRPRPIYSDYDDYEDRYERRGGSRRRRPYDRDRRPLRRDQDRRKYEYDDGEEEDDRYEYDDFTLDRKPNRKYEDDYDEYDRRETTRTRTKQDEKPNRRPYDNNRKPLREENQNRKSTRLGARRPPSEDYEDELQGTEKAGSSIMRSEDGRPVIKPVSGTIYDRPRLAPRINLPVPKNAANKFAYKPISGFQETAVKESNDSVEEPKDNSKLPTNTEQSVEDNINPSRFLKRPKLEPTTTDTPRVSLRRRPSQADQAPEPKSAEDQGELVPEKTGLAMRKFRRPVLPSKTSPGSPKSRPSSDIQEQSTTQTETTSELKTTPGGEFRVKGPREDFPVKPSPVRVKVPIRVTKFKEKTTEVPKLETLYDTYDVTLNEASPVVNLAPQSYPTGFSNSFYSYDNNRFYRSSRL